MNRTDTAHGIGVVTGALCAGVLLAGCSLLPATDPVAVDRYSLDYVVPEMSLDPAGPVILVTRTRTRAGLSSARMMYRGDHHRIGYFTRSQWIAPPGELLTSLVMDVLESTGYFSSVVGPGSPVRDDLRLELELAALHPDFSVEPAEALLRVRAQLLDTRQSKVVASRQFEYSAALSKPDAEAGVLSLNRLVALFLPELAQFSTRDQPK